MKFIHIGELLMVRRVEANQTDIYIVEQHGTQDKGERVSLKFHGTLKACLTGSDIVGLEK